MSDPSTGRRGRTPASMVGYSRAQAFADPSLADPFRFGGGLRTQETGSGEGARNLEEA